jgi:hypothetical protein
MGFPILGSQYLVNYSFWVIYNITDSSKEKMGPQRMQATIEAMSSKEWTAAKCQNFHNLSSTSQQPQNATLG